MFFVVSALVEGSLKNRLLLLPLLPSSDPLAFPHRLMHGAAKLEKARAAGPCFEVFFNTVMYCNVLCSNDLFCFLMFCVVLRSIMSYFVHESLLIFLK